MAKIRVAKFINNDGKKIRGDQYLYFCPGCGYEHAFSLKSESGNHEFNMNLDKPTVSPSLLQNFVPGKLCHSYIIEGKIKYLNDCQHSLAGQTVELPEIV
jgi:hypothetical protein